MAILILVNAGPYGNESTLRVFLLGDGVGCAVPGQRTPSGYYDVERMIRHLVSSGVEVHACLTCMEARGLASVEIIDGVEPSNVDELAAWVCDSDRVLTF